MCKFTHLHTHTDASPDGLGTTGNLIKTAAELGFDSLAMTDHGTLANSVKFWSECKEYDIKPILGLEAYMLWEGQRYHVTLNALNEEGFNNLIRMSNLAHENWTSGYPLMTIDHMGAYSKGVAAFSGCPASPIHSGTYEDGLKWAADMKEVFGENFYAELMFVMDEDVVSRPLEIADELDLKIIVTNDVHFPKNGQQAIHKIMTECRKGYNYESSELWLKNYDQMVDTGLKYFDGKDLKQWLQNSYEFSESVENWNMYAKPNLPEATELVKEFYIDLSNAYLDDIENRDIEEVTIRTNRKNYELEILEGSDFIDYFAIIYHLVKYAKERDILVGPGRGSAASSYILSLLGVTGLDPIHHNLPFERFMNPMRKEYPDIDLDFDSERRQEVLNYANERWGAVPIATYSHYSHKILTNDLGRILGISQPITKEAADKGKESDAFELFVNQHPKALEAYEAMEGQIRHKGKHAGGMIITDKVIPIERVGDNLVAAWTEGLEDRHLGAVGVVKADALGLQALAQIHRMKKETGLKVDFVDPEDPSLSKVYEIFQTGDVLGIFQWTGSDGIRKLTMDICPTEFADLVVINSLYRPGALDAGTAMKYPEFKLSPRKIHPLIDDILEETNGAIVFQEQVMGIIQTILGGTLAEADLARRLIFKPKHGDPKWEKEIDNLKNNFVDSGISKGIDKHQINNIWAEIFTHSRYSFNKSHSASYSIIAFTMAYYKMYHPEVFYSVMMTTDTANVQPYLIESVSKGITYKMPNINNPFFEYKFEDGTINIPINIVNYISSDSAEYIKNEFDENGPFKSYADFDDRIPGKKCTSRAIKYLYYLNAFEGLDGELTDIGRFKELPELPEAAERQMEALGFIIPSEKVANAIINSTEEDPIGFVKDWKDKTNKRGNAYRVYYLSPYGSFWTDDKSKIKKIEKGMLIAVNKTSYGKGSRVKKLKW